MVVKMMRWRPWPPLISRKYEVRIMVRALEGFDWVHEGTDKDNGGLAVEIRWKGPKFSLSSLRRTVKRNCTGVGTVKSGLNGGVLVEWDEEFRNVCRLSGYKDDNEFHPWEINFTVLLALNQGAKNKVSVIGLASLNLSIFALKTEEHVTEVKIPLTVSSTGVENQPMLSMSLSLLELRNSKESSESVRSPMVPIGPIPSPSLSGESSVEKDEVSTLKAGLRKVKIFTEYVATRKDKKSCREDDGSEGRCSAKSDEGEYGYPFDSDSVEEFEDGDSEEVKEDPNVRKSFSYGTLAYANYAGVSYYSSSRIDNENEDWIYYSNRRRSDVGCPQKEDLTSGVVQPSLFLNPKRSILPWKKRKLSFRSPKAKGEPLLKKAYEEEGGDDIDFDRRQISSDESLACLWHKTDEVSIQFSVSEFGDDSFSVGTWEQKEITSRDGHMKIQTQVFFASIDQRSERAAGESACTALVAVIADWLQHNHDLMPIKSQFDSLIRDGSLEWRRLCEKETYREQYPDKHFDLETVLEAEVRDLVVVPGKSFIGFFHPEGMEGGNFDFLHSAMSFDKIWDEINHSDNSKAQVFIVSWNDHFFVLKVEKDVYYIIDTLGERLHEGCNQAYILKFDRDTSIFKMPDTELSSEEKSIGEPEAANAAVEPQKPTAQPTSLQESCKEGLLFPGPENAGPNGSEEQVVCQGKESCKEYIKSFLAAIPIRELQEDIKKGQTMSALLHRRLQVEFNFTQLREPVPPLTRQY